MLDFLTRVERTKEIKIYLGCREGYTNREFSEEDLIKKISEFQLSYGPDFASVRITKTLYINKEYAEGGWEISVMNYPPRPRTNKQLKLFADKLAVHLMESFKQQRVTMVKNRVTKTFDLNKA